MVTPRSAKMSVKHIIFKIDEVIRNTDTPREQKIESLQNLAITCWQEVIPAYSAPSVFKKLGSDEIQERWANVREYVETYQTKAQILYVLDWPASSGNFYWIK